MKKITAITIRWDNGFLTTDDIKWAKQMIRLSERLIKGKVIKKVQF